jgi:hypothetical protein
MRRSGQWALFFFLWVVTTPWVPAAPVRSHEIATADAFAQGTLDGMLVDGEGALAIAPPFRTLWGPEKGVVWAVAPDGRGGGFVGLGSPGRLLHVTADGEVVLWEADSDAEMVTALAPDGDGGVYLGISPGGTVLHARPPDRVDEIADLDAEFVWALLATGRGDLWIGTGSPGGIVVRREDGSRENRFESNDDPVRSLALLPDGNILAGTGREGRVVRFGPAAEGPFVLFDAEEEEIVSIAPAAGGRVFFLAVRVPSKSPVKPPDGKEPQAGTPGTVRVRVVANAENGGAESRKNGKPTEPRPTKIAEGRTGGALYRSDPDGGVWKIWESKSETPFGVVVNSEGLPLVATGRKGRILRLDQDGEAVRLMRFPSNMASAITSAADGTILIGGTSDARLALLGPGLSEKGSFLSEPLDAGSIANWGRVHWSADVPRGAMLRLSARAGNTSKPDGNWTGWRPVDVGEDIGSTPIDLPASRWLQLRVEMEPSRSVATPRLRVIEAFYMPWNRPPAIQDLQVEPPGVAWARRQQGSTGLGPLVAEDPVARQAAESLRGGRSAGSVIRKAYETGARTFHWQASDPDGDDLTFSLEIRGDGEERWFPLARRIEDTFFSWDSRSVPDGRYRVRLTADDGNDNGGDGGFARQRMSDPFPVDNTPPSISRLRVESTAAGYELRFDARDPGGQLSSVEFAIGDGPWKALYPEDGVADSDAESYLLSVGLGSGQEARRFLRLRVTDVTGNVGGALRVLAAER